MLTAPPTHSGPHPRVPLVVAAAGALLVAACGAGDAPARGDAVAVTDSAGVAIVESEAPVWGASAGWEVSPEPALRIGTVTGDQEYQLHRVMATTRLGDGRIVVANAGSSTIRYYDEAGRHLREVGGEGEGPGEFLLPARVWGLPEDSVAVFDGRTSRVTVLDPAGELARTVPLTRVDTLGIPSVHTAFADGTLLSVSGTGTVSPQEGLIEGAPWFYTRFSGEGEALNRLGSGMGGDRWGTDHRGGFSFDYLPLVLGIPPYAPGPDAFFFGQGDRFELEERDLEGGLVRIVRWEAEPRPVTRDVVARLAEHRAEAVPAEERAAVTRWVEGLPLPSELPAYDEMRLDALGHLWVRQYRPPWDEGPQRWWVFDPEGAWLGEVETPAQMRVDEIGEDHLLGVETDEMGVEFVVVLGLERGI